MKRSFLALLALPLAVASLAAAAAPAGAASSDKKIAKSGLIVAKDVPSSWESTPADPDSDEQVEQLAAQFPECVDYLDSREQLDKALNASSRQFSSRDGDELSNETWVFEKTAAARAAFDAIGAPTNANCLTLLFQEAFEQQIAADPETAAQVTGIRTFVNATNSLPSNGDDQLGYVGTVQFTMTDGSTQQLLLAYFAVRTGRGILGYTITASSVDGSFASSFATASEKAIDVTATRMEKALK